MRWFEKIVRRRWSVWNNWRFCTVMQMMKEKKQTKKAVMVIWVM